MAEANTPAQNAADPAEPRTFTQEEVNTMCAREAGRTERALLKQLGLADKSGLADLLTQVQTAQSMGQSLQTVTGERDDYKQKYEDTLAGLNALKNTQTLASYGVTEADEQEFMAFKIGTLVTDKKDFAARCV